MCFSASFLNLSCLAKSPGLDLHCQPSLLACWWEQSSHPCQGQQCPASFSGFSSCEDHDQDGTSHSAFTQKACPPPGGAFPSSLAASYQGEYWRKRPTLEERSAKVTTDSVHQHHRCQGSFFWDTWFLCWPLNRYWCRISLPKCFLSTSYWQVVNLSWWLMMSLTHIQSLDQSE